MHETGRKEHLEGRRFMRIPVGDIYTGYDPKQRESVSLVQLAASIARHGLLQPVVVMENSEMGRYKLICGLRRLKASKMAGHDTVEALVLSCSEQEAAACYLEEHLTREDPSAILEARMIEGVGAERVSACFALAKEEIDDRAALLTLPESVQNEIEKNRLSLEQVKPLTCIRNPLRQLEAASIIAQRALGGRQAKRLVFGPQQEEIGRCGKRRAAGIFMETINRAVEELRARGMHIQVHMHTQDGSMCIRLVMKNGACRMVEAGNKE